MLNRLAARSIVRTTQLIAHPVDLVMQIILPIILPCIHPIIRALDDPFILSVGRPSPTFHPIVRPTDDPIVLPLIRPIIHPIDDPFNLTVRRPSPILSQSAIQSDGSLIPIITAPPWNRPSNRINKNQLKSTVPAIILLTIQVRPSQAEPNRPPDLTQNSLKSSEEGYSIAMSEWPALLHTEKVTFLFQHLPGLAFKPPAGLSTKIMKDPPPNRSFLTWPAD